MVFLIAATAATGGIALVATPSLEVRAALATEFCYITKNFGWNKKYLVLGGSKFIAFRGICVIMESSLDWLQGLAHTAVHGSRSSASNYFYTFSSCIIVTHTILAWPKPFLNSKLPKLFPISPLPRQSGLQ